MNADVFPRYPMNKLRMLLVAAATAGLTLVARAQVDSTFTAETAAASIEAGTKVTARLVARMDPGWHISSLTTPDGGPVRTEIRLAKGQPFKLAGKIDVADPIKRHSDAFGVDVETYEGEVAFTLPLEATMAVRAGTKVLVQFYYQACNEDTCMLPKPVKLEAAVTLNAAKAGK